MKPTTKRVGRGHLPGNPFMFGFTLVNGRPIKPLSRKHAVHRARGFSIETTPDIGHCPYGTWWDEGVNHRDEFHAFTVERQGDVLRGACDFTATRTERDQAKVELKITWTATIIGGTQVEGQAEVRWKDMVVTRPLLGIVRQGLDDLIDPLNCIYQFTGSSDKPDSAAWAVVEVKEGKPVRSLGHVRGQSEIRLRQVNADSLRITRHDHGVNGWKADLDGSIAIEGGPTFALGGLKIGVNGIGWFGKNTPLQVRAYHPQHPVARGWEGLAKAIFAQVPVPAEAAERAKRQAAEQPALPPPSAATKYHFTHRATGWPMPYAFTYAPWLDFEAVDGDAQYRFELFKPGRNAGTVEETGKSFTAASPRKATGTPRRYSRSLWPSAATPSASFGIGRTEGNFQRGDEYAVSPPSARYLATLDAAGFVARLAFDPRLKGTPSSLVPWNAATLRREVVASISERKWPVLLVDLPEPGWNALITGLEDGGETLVGWCEEGWESSGVRFDPAMRKQIAEIVLKCRGRDLEGARKIEEALSK